MGGEFDSIRLSGVAAELHSKYAELNRALEIIGKLSTGVFWLTPPRSGCTRRATIYLAKYKEYWLQFY